MLGGKLRQDIIIQIASPPLDTNRQILKLRISPLSTIWIIIITFKKNNQGGGGRTQSATGDGGTRQGEEAATAQVFFNIDDVDKNPLIYEAQVFVNIKNPWLKKLQQLK